MSPAVEHAFAALGVVTFACLVMLVAAGVAVSAVAALGLRFHWRPFFLGVSPEGAPFTAAIGSEDRLPEGSWVLSRPSRRYGWWVWYVWMPWGWAAFERRWDALLKVEPPEGRARARRRP